MFWKTSFSYSYSPSALAASGLTFNTSLLHHLPGFSCFVVNVLKPPSVSLGSLMITQPSHSPFLTPVERILDLGRDSFDEGQVVDSHRAFLILSNINVVFDDEFGPSIFLGHAHRGKGSE